MDLDDLTGRLFVIEGPDAVGRSTQIAFLRQWLEANGHAVATVGLSRSSLAGPELDAAKEGNLLRPKTMALFYAADLYDQLENQMIPALRAGCVVLADRYIHSLMARSMVRGCDRDWLATAYESLLQPHAVYYMRAAPKRLLERALHKYGQLDHWEAGMDLGLDKHYTRSFVVYQKRVRKIIEELGRDYPFETLNADRSVPTIQKELRERISRHLPGNTTPSP